MPYYEVTNTYTYTTTTFVEADSASEAKELSYDLEGKRYLEDSQEVVEVSEEEYEINR